MVSESSHTEMSKITYLSFHQQLREDREFSSNNFGVRKLEI
jgi:hypothetical protein